MPLLSRSLARHPSLFEQTYQLLRTAILSGDLSAGARLIETQLAELFQVSRTPIREAIRQLQRDRLVTADANGWLRVATISQTDAIQLYDCRIALEQLSVAGACQHATEIDLEALQQMVLQAEKAVQGKPSHLLDFQRLDQDYQFHRRLAESSGNQWLVHVLDNVFDKMALLRLQTTRSNPAVLETCTEHRRINDAVQARDSDAAIAAIRYHLSASKQRVVSEIQNLQTADEATL